MTSGIGQLNMVKLAPVYAFLAAQVLELLTPDAWVISLMGGVAGALGILVNIYFRDKRDVADKYKFFYAKDVYGIVIWFLVGGFVLLSLVLIKSAWNALPAPVLFIPACLFLPLVWVSFENHLPGMLVRFWEAVRVLAGLQKVGNGGGSNGRTSNKED